ncbi:PHB depolymerase family esterase [Shewanella sp. D64]|uniref:extracellular catalytic domain type 1 short-chain-length polyhydroxyalkanoate depolymerase n=1 Tax=unclassified Shewanella TaxID=196818 RepID=UPI0022BA4176|nr:MULTISPECIES: PHB depolymerase family esterase [unclassified Shewanella]MEC4725160.1 PHB depolymerase family esterase [Shewanella sp. D64]MEC4737061.1 PHB depolymerase family esterase [Shewanella sp. E94]WBJ96646.1 PHB depolymerase family esterase [Shewanella sp. MTB7]
MKWIKAKKPLISLWLLVILGLCVGSASAGSWQQDVTIGGFNNVHIYTPDGVSTIGQGKSLLIVLHGCVQPINNYLTANLEQAAEAHGMVIAVPDAMNKAGYSCWSYWQGSINRNSGGYKNLISLANTMSGDVSRNIDPKQIYIAGLSSGGAMAAQTACVAPEVFAGVASSAGPTIGTSSNGAITTCESVTAPTFKSRCEGYAGSYKNHFATQLAVIGHGAADTTVNSCYNQQNADGFALVYGVSQVSGSNNLSDGSGHTAQETLWSDKRVSMLWFDGLDHSWSGGAGASGDYVAANSINFATYLGQFFSDNNRRVDRNTGPLLTNLTVVNNASSLLITGTAIDSEGSVSRVDLKIYRLGSGTPELVESINTQISTVDDSFSASTATLIDGLYSVSAIAIDNESKAGDEALISVRVGPEPEATPPQLSGISAAISGQCATITGLVLDINQNLVLVTVGFANGVNVDASVVNTSNGQQYSAEGCNLAGGSQIATVVATDLSGLSSSDLVVFTIDAGITGDYNLHINQGHIAWGVGYSACYLAFGTADFTMREYPAGTNLCQWVADGAATCAGPIQACIGGGAGTPDSDNDGIADSSDNCVNTANGDQADNDGDGIGNVCDSTPDGEVFQCTESTTSNYAHVQAGRAITNGYYVFALGSGANMGLYNVFYSTTLAETNNSYFVIGSCP